MVEGSKSSSFREDLLRGTFSGAFIFAAIFALIFGLTGISLFGISGIFGIFMGAFLGLFIGGALGFLFSMMPPGVRHWVSIILLISIIAVLGYLTFTWSKSGAFQVLIAPLGLDWERIALSLQKGVTCVRNPVDCLFKPFYDWSEPTVLEENIEEVVVDVDFSNTKPLFFEGEPIAISTAVVVNNPYYQFYTIEPKCFLDGEEMEIRENPMIDGGLIDFRKSDIDQRVSVICEKKSGISLNESDEGKEIKAVNFELHLIRTMTTRAEWNVYTLHRDVLEKKANPFEGVNEPNLRGFSVLSEMQFNSPLKLSIGSDNDQPFFEAKWPFSVILRKKDVPGEFLQLRSVTLEESTSRNVRIAQPCEFESGYGSFTLSGSKLSRATEILRREQPIPIDIQCTLFVQGLSSQKQAPEKTVLKATAEFDFESVFKRTITIMSGIEREDL